MSVLFLALSATTLLQVAFYLRLGYVRVFFSAIYRDMEPVWYWTVMFFGILFVVASFAGAVWVDQWPQIRIV